LRPVTLKSRADHTDGIWPSQDCVLFTYLVDSYDFIAGIPEERGGGHRTAKAPFALERTKAGGAIAAIARQQQAFENLYLGKAGSFCGIRGAGLPTVVPEAATSRELNWTAIFARS
jgi:hypothetical protein